MLVQKLCPQSEWLDCFGPIGSYWAGTEGVLGGIWTDLFVRYFGTLEKYYIRGLGFGIP